MLPVKNRRNAVGGFLTAALLVAGVVGVAIAEPTVTKHLCAELIKRSQSASHFFVLDPSDCMTCSSARKKLIAAHVARPDTLAVFLTRVPTTFEHKQLDLAHVKSTRSMSAFEHFWVGADSVVACAQR